MPDFRGDIRRVIFTKLRDNSISVMDDAKAINKILGEYSKRYKDFDQLEKLNIELTVPIQLPPNGTIGDCKAVVLEVQKSFNELGGGSRIYHALGSWLDNENNVVADDCVVVYTAMSMKKWFECIPVLQRLIRDEIQTKLFQECVFLRIDNQTFGDPLNLLGKQIQDFPSVHEFGGIDPACEMIVVEYESHPVQTVINQEIRGDGNIQLNSEGDNILVTGGGAMVAKGDIHVHQGIAPKEHARLLAEKQRLEEKLAQMNEENDENRRKQIAVEATKLAKAMQENKNFKFDAWKLNEIGSAAKLAGQLERAEGYYKQALRKFKSDDDKKGEAYSLNNLGMIARTRGDLSEAERLYRESLAIKIEIGDRQGEASSLNNLGIIAKARGDLVEAERLYRESLAINIEIGDKEGEAKSLNNLGEITTSRGDLTEAERLYRESLEIFVEIGNLEAEEYVLRNLGKIARARE